jgi:hypothetical protein
MRYSPCLSGFSRKSACATFYNFGLFIAHWYGVALRVAAKKGAKNSGDLENINTFEMWGL